MAVLRRPYARARKLAREVLLQCGMDGAGKIDPFVVVGVHKILVVYCPLDGATAQLLRRGERAIIRVSDKIVQIGRLRFTIAHELGHFLLGHRIPSELDLDAAPPFSLHQEREADVFAAEFLMPEELVRPFCAAPTSLAAVNAIVDSFRTSVVASAVRFVELASAPRAVVYTEHGHVVWAKRSATFPGRIPVQLKLRAGSIAFDKHEHGVLDAGPRIVDASAWLGVHQESVGPLVEHATMIPEPRWGGVLSMLSASSDF